MLNRKINQLIVIDPGSGQEIMTLDKEDAVDLATQILNLAGQITEEDEDE